MTKKEPKEMVRIFRALAVEKRIEIVQLLAGSRLCVGALSNFVGISAGAVSQHLRILKDAGLIESVRCGSFIHYSLAPESRELCRAVTTSLFDANEEHGRCVARKRGSKGQKSCKADQKRNS